MKKVIIIILIVVTGILYASKPFNRPQSTKVEITQQIGLPNSVVETLKGLLKP